jgi:hypothetical protein
MIEKQYQNNKIRLQTLDAIEDFENNKLISEQSHYFYNSSLFDLNLSSQNQSNSQKVIHPHQSVFKD